MSKKAYDKIADGLREAQDWTRNFGPGSFGCHEAMHMASVLAEMVEERLCEHPSIHATRRWRRKADAAAALLHELYQEIGAAHLKHPEAGADG